VESGSVDAVVSTIVLCTVGKPDQCLQEIIRVLKPGGKFFFLEHVKSPPQFYIIRFLQVISWLMWPVLFDGCHLTRRTQDNIRKAGFSSVDIEEFEAHELIKPVKVMPIVCLIRSHIAGTATK